MYGVNSTIKLKAKDILTVAKDLIDTGKEVCITVTGNSMYPFLRDSKDNVVLTFVEYRDVRLGDILLVLHNDDMYVLHRIIRKNKLYFYTNGDALGYREGPLYPEQIIAKVVSVRRKDKEIRCDNPVWRGLGFLWFLLFPFRDLIINSYRLLSRIIKPLRSR